MGLFDGLAGELDRIAAGLQVRDSAISPVARWRPGGAPPVVLRDEAALELGRPGAGSLLLALWDEQPGRVAHGRVRLAGPELAALPRSASLALVVVARARAPLEQPHERHRELREAIYAGTALRGVMTRVLPSQHSVWMRVTRAALQQGLDAGVIASAVLEPVRELPWVRGAEVLLVTGAPRAEAALEPVASMVLDISGALLKMQQQELTLDCEGCEFEAVCDAVGELRRLHRQLEREARP